MKLYVSQGPNPKTVRLFLATKGIDIPVERVDIVKGDNRKPDYLAINPTGQTPALVLDDGRIITEITAICEYLEELHPSPPMFGITPEERAETRMWTRRIDLNILEPLLNGYRSGEGAEFFKGRMHLMPHAAHDLKKIGHHWVAWLDKQIEGKTWICGDRYSFPDLLLYVFLDFIGSVSQPPDPELGNVAAWMARMKALPVMAKK